jgi:hypothetical protein
MAFRDLGNKPLLDTQGLQTNAADQTVHADPGVLNANGARRKFFEVRCICGGSVAAVWQLQRRNAANGANVAPSPYTFYTAAGQSSEFVVLIQVEETERIRLTNSGAITGTTAGSLQIEALT